MKKIILLALTLTFIIFSIGSVNATENLIKIDQEHFPGPVLRYHVCKYYDKNHDGFLSKSEIKAVKKYKFDYFGIYTHVWLISTNSAKKGYDPQDHLGWPEPEYTKLRKFLHDFKGIEIFYNLEYVKLYHSEFTKQIEIKNIKSLFKLKKIKYLWIENTKKITYDLRKMKSLKTLKLVGSDIKKIKFCKNPKIKKVTASWSKGALDLSKLSKLKSFYANYTSIEKVTFGKKNKKVKSVKILGESDKPSKIKKLDLSKLKNLKTLWLDDLPKLKKVYISKKNKLEEDPWIHIVNCKKMKKKKIIYK